MWDTQTFHLWSKEVLDSNWCSHGSMFPEFCDQSSLHVCGLWSLALGYHNAEIMAPLLRSQSWQTSYMRGWEKDRESASRFFFIILKIAHEYPRRRGRGVLTSFVMYEDLVPSLTQCYRKLHLHLISVRSPEKPENVMLTWKSGWTKPNSNLMIKNPQVFGHRRPHPP